MIRGGKFGVLLSELDGGTLKLLKIETSNLCNLLRRDTLFKIKKDYLGNKGS